MAALKLKEKFIESENIQTPVDCELDCSSVPNFQRSLDAFTCNSNLGRYTHRGWINSKLLSKIYQDLCEKYTDQYIFFRFYNAELDSQIVRCLDDSICKLLTTVPRQPHWDYAKVKVIVETQEGDNRKWLAGCYRLNTSNFFHIKAFTLEMTIDFFKSVRDLSSTDIERLHKLYGGHPEALDVAREEILDNKVISCILCPFIFILNGFRAQTRGELLQSFTIFDSSGQYSVSSLTVFF